ncbi:MAG TPA: GNAT family N-acetyltransferase [Puia sp.]|jgi:GNAT superfamily N-acetyltransferase
MTVLPMLPQHAGALEQLQRIVFPALAFDERLRAEHYLTHLQVFPEGQFVLTNGETEPGIGPPAGMTGQAQLPIIGMTTTQRMNFDPSSCQHTFMETSGGGWMSRHQPEGEWLYGLDMGIHPEFRGRGGARLLYRARQLLVRQLGLRGQLTVGMMNGYGAVGDKMGGEEYYRQWLEGRREDPTLTRQRKIGFEPLGLIADYLHDPTCGNYGVLLRLDAGHEV